MCGILGVADFNNPLKNLPFEKALKSIAYRGPDNSDFFQNDNIFLGHNRLSIIDTSEAAHQPFSFQNRYYLIFNGEIFNYKEIKKQLIEEQKIEFQTNSDTEVLLHLLIHKKTEASAWLNGFFAFAFYDQKNETLLIARDRFGIKPLYFYNNQTQLSFASELLPLVQLYNPKNINQQALHDYLQFNFLPPEKSMIENIHQLKPGSYIQFDKSGMKQDEFYKLPSCNSVSQKNVENPEKELYKLLNEAVEKQMISDVPLGCFLSGGIDSSIVCALAAQQTQKLKTFTIGFKDNAFLDESKYAEIVAKKYKTDHQCIYISEDELLEDVDFLLDNISEPFADSSAIAVNTLCKHTAKEVKVALSGDGADELFGGYYRHRAALMMQENIFSGQMIKTFYPLLKKIKPNQNSPFGNKIRQMQKYGRLANLDFYNRYIALSENITAEKAAKLLENKVEDKSCDKNIAALLNEKCGIQSYLLNDMTFILPGDMLYKTDRFSMLHSLEVRPVFLDNEVAEFAMNLPIKYKLDKNQGKKIVRNTFAHLLPKELLNRPKHGFEVPLAKWLCTALKNDLETLTAQDFIKNQGIFNFDTIANLKKALYKTRRKDFAATLWAVMVFNKWWKKLVDG